MLRPSDLKVGTAPDNGLVGQSRGRRPGPLFGSENLIESWSRTYKKYAWDFRFSSIDGFISQRYVLYQVTVRGDGSIRVKPGDWISKYSDAIHGNPWRWSEYKQNWDKIVDKTYSHLRVTAVRSVKAKILKEGEHPLDPELALKVGLRLAGKNDRSKLAELLRQKYSGK